MSPRSMRRASATSCSAVSRLTRPMARRYSRSESSDGSTVRSTSTFLRVSPPSPSDPRWAPALLAPPPAPPVGPGVGPRLDGLALGLGQATIGADDRDALLVEVGMQFLDLLLGDLPLLQAGFDLG